MRFGIFFVVNIFTPKSFVRVLADFCALCKKSRCFLNHKGHRRSRLLMSLCLFTINRITRKNIFRLIFQLLAKSPWKLNRPQEAKIKRSYSALRDNFAKTKVKLILKAPNQRHQHVGSELRSQPHNYNFPFYKNSETSQLSSQSYNAADLASFEDF